MDLAVHPPPNAVSRSRPTILSIQYLRGLAAMLVVVHHAMAAPAPWLFNPTPNTALGGAGVYIFFVISGFIMFTAGRDEPPMEFVRRRIVRVVPLYWIATTIVFVSYAETLAGLLRAPMYWAHVYAFSLFFIPYYDAHGEIWPLHVPGWTLNFEMFFYAIFAFGLMLKRPAALPSLLIVALVVSGLFIDRSNAIISTYTNPILLLFMAGIWLGWLFAQEKLPRAPLLLPMGLVVLGVAAFTAHSGYREFALMAGAGVTVFGALGTETGVHKARPVLKLLGDASYSIYLAHTLVINFILNMCKAIPLSGWAQFLTTVTISTAGAAAIGIGVHFLVERPVTRWLERLTKNFIGRTSGRKALQPVR